MSAIVFIGFSFSGESVASAFQLLQSDLAADVRQGALQIVAHAGAFALAAIGLAGMVSWGGKLIRRRRAPKSDDILK